jgi:hypothetical protein
VRFQDLEVNRPDGFHLVAGVSCNGTPTAPTTSARIQTDADSREGDVAQERNTAAGEGARSSQLTAIIPMSRFMQSDSTGGVEMGFWQ